MESLAEGAELAPEMAEPAVKPTAGASRRVPLVDDNMFVAETIQHFLVRQGYLVT